MKLGRFMDEAYQGKAQARRLKTKEGDLVFGLEDLADRVGTKPSRADVEQLAPGEARLLNQLLVADPGRKYSLIWGYLSSIAAERSPDPLLLRARDFAGLELSGGILVLDGAADHVGERMTGGRIIVQGRAGDHLGQLMSGGLVVAKGCRDYAFRNMRSGRGAILGDAGKFCGLGNSGGRVAVRGNCGERAGWLMHGGSLRIRGNAGDYLGLLMSGGDIVVRGRAGKRAGWRMKGGCIRGGGFGPEAATDVMGLE